MRRMICALALQLGAASMVFARSYPCGNVYGPVGVEGIGDGCSASIAGYLLPEIAAFRSTSTNACNAHDA
jgi:hypothetical protein